MNIDVSESFNQIVKRVHFFPYEWNTNLLAVCFTDSIKFYHLEELVRKEVDIIFILKIFLNLI